MLQGEDSLLMYKINSYLARDLLDIEIKDIKSSVFENVWRGEINVLPRITDLVYKVELLNERIYVVTMTGEGCGAYCEEFDMTYTFDLTSGDRIELKQLFGFGGQLDLVNEMITYKKGKIDAKLKEVKKLLLNRELEAGLREHYEEMVILYENCNASNTTLEYIRFIPTETSLKLIAGRCSAHVNRPLDDLWYYEIEIQLSDWTHRLSDYGAWRLSQ